MADNLNDGEDVQLVDEEEEVEESALFHSYPVYYVQSPSNTSHAYSDSKTFNQHDSSFPSPIPHTANDPANATQDVSRFVLLSYSSSRASTNSFHHHFKNAASYELQVHGGAAGNACERGDQDGHDEVDDNDEDYEVVDSNNDRGSNGGRKHVNDIALVRSGSKRRGCWRFFSFSTSSSSCWIAIQLFWRLMVSVGAALLVFYLATKPPPPKMFVKMAGVRQFVLGEGVDGSGVSSKILTCNCTISLTIDNNSKVFGLHIQPSEIELSFGPLIFASSRGTELYAMSQGSSNFELFVGTASKPMYGAGRSMQDLLELDGLPLLIRIRLRSNFKIMGNLINPIFHHRAQCSLLIKNSYDKRHHTQSYLSNCTIFSTK